METRLKEALWEGEEVRWSGRPKPFELMEQSFKSSILLTWAVSACVLAAVLYLLVTSLASGTRTIGDAFILAIITLFLPAILSARPIMDKKCLEEKTIYAITNFRIIAIVKDEVMYLPIGKGMKVAVEQQADGCGNLRFGELVGKPSKKSRAHAVLGLRSSDESRDVQGLLFYHVDQPDQLMRYLA
ncbi:hypothetical protein [Flavonifractor sp. An100]|uniref:hypothetical protein n=1 Tax=Flavonifractor sp. An100 TaxID=1965538 RepID=UPI000B3A690D|nr:hypothetical protein [Flavonifractor sp. An100]OUQ82223.1 hypothetical protein B5E43_00105 [Flavonifractor sp. An100]